MKKKVIIGIVVIVLIIVGIILNNQNQNINEISGEDHFDNGIVNERIMVQISGEVVYPGIYEVNSDDRINDLVILAGGFTKKADTSINLVEKLNDGQIVIIPSKSKTNTNGLISINYGSLQELDSLDGIGPSKAQSIIDYRERNGLFNSIDELKKVTGISSAIYDVIKDKICL